MTDSNTPHPSPERLAAFDQGQLSPSEWAEIEDHVAGCDVCCRLLEGVPDDRLISLLRTTASGIIDTRCQQGDTPVSTPPRVEIPAELANHPRYHVLQLLGVGGMGAVFKAEHRL